jgi:hypothetical protein
MSTSHSQRGKVAAGTGSRLRVVGVALAVLAVLVYFNLAQIDDDNEVAFRSTGVLTPNIERVIADRRAEVVSNAITEYLALTVAAAGALIALSGPQLHRLVLRARTPSM